MSDAIPADSAPNADRFAARLRGFGPVGIAAMVLILLTGNIAVAPMVFVPVGALLTLAWVMRSGTPWSAIGYVKPRSWSLTILGGVLAGAAFKLLMKSVVMPLIGAPPVNATYHFLEGNRALLPAAILAMVNAGFSEETVFRGYLYERLGRLFGASTLAKTAIVVLVAALFGAAHYQQGLPGIEQATITGLVFGAIVMATQRLPFTMVAHAAFDLTALALIYLGLETRVAEWFFR